MEKGKRKREDKAHYDSKSDGSASKGVTWVYSCRVTGDDDAALRMKPHMKTIVMHHWDKHINRVSGELELFENGEHDDVETYIRFFKFPSAKSAKTAIMLADTVANSIEYDGSKANDTFYDFFEPPPYRSLKHGMNGYVNEFGQCTSK